MKTITISRNIIPKGYYAEDVVEAGHVPGTLSGAALQGRAKEYGGWYADMRSRVTHAIYTAYGVDSHLVLTGNPARWTRVWSVDEVPVRLVLDG